MPAVPVSPFIYAAYKSTKITICPMIRYLFIFHLPEIEVQSDIDRQAAQIKFLKTLKI